MARLAARALATDLQPLPDHQQPGRDDHPPVSENWLTSFFRGLGVTLEQLRVDRQLDEALTAGPDPLHLASVFGIGDETAIRYAAAARHLLASAAEDQPPR
jgi:hypothetical protein